ncbi:MAG: hypothetical protein V1742_04495 [Pseudomonadota bacterium]
MAKACIIDAAEKVQQGIDPYDLIAGDEAEAECRACGHVFVPQEAEEENGAISPQSDLNNNLK